MNGRMAKKLRRAVYGDNASQHRRYKFRGGTLVADELRQAYQRAKRLWRERGKG